MDKKTLLAFVVIILLLVGCSSKGNKVHVCISSGAERYHYDEDCSGFNHCTHERREVTLSEAKAMGYTVCRME